MIEFREFSFTYWGHGQPALKNVNLTMDEGEFVLITGPSGSGKSSLCRCLNALIPHFHGGTLSGTVLVDGLDITLHQPHEFATRVGMVFQDPENQLVATDVERDIAFGLENLALPRDLIARRVEEALDTLGIAHLRREPLAGLSGGEKQKAAIAAVLALHPRVLVLDEPSSELDPKSAEELLSAVAHLNEELGITIVLVEHRLDRVVQYADRLVVLRDGSVVADGSPRLVLRSEELPASGVGVPPVARLVTELGRRGVQINEIPVTVKEARNILGPLLGAGNLKGHRDEPIHQGAELVTVEDLWHRYDEGSPALRGVSLKLRGGEMLAVMGRNASGKTTLVKHFNGLLKPWKGKVRVAGTDTRDATVAELARTVGFVFQNPNDHLFADTVEQEILFTLNHLGIGSPEAQERLEQALRRFGLTEYRAHYPRALSGGERQRVALASVIAAQPRVLVLDEPTRGMEYGLKRSLMEFLYEYRREGNAVVLVTHDVETSAAHADRVLLLSEGQVVAEGPTRQVLSEALLFSPQVNRLTQPYLVGRGSGAYMTVEDLLEDLA